MSRYFGEEVVLAEIDKRIAALESWSRTANKNKRTKPAREAFLARFEREVDPEGVLPPRERRERAELAKRAYMLRLAKRSAQVRKRG
ncbi:hypothetical protein [Actinomadura macra]|uniref:hypothetical protein n=1 Tax=Actinomadura macra TaxID=46164 RepID=UPI000AB0EE5A|nr:hypothetical protein [Actinomadura macra]